MSHTAALLTHNCFFLFIFFFSLLFFLSAQHYNQVYSNNQSFIPINVSRQCIGQWLATLVGLVISDFDQELRWNHFDMLWYSVIFMLYEGLLSLLANSKKKPSGTVLLLKTKWISEGEPCLHSSLWSYFGLKVTALIFPIRGIWPWLAKLTWKSCSLGVAVVCWCSLKDCFVSTLAGLYCTQSFSPQP